MSAASAGDERPVVLCLRSGGLDLAVPIAEVLRASYLVAAQPVPGTPDYLVGITKVAGRTMPLADLAGRLGLAGPERFSVDAPVVWCEADGSAAGFVVDQIVGVAEVEGDATALAGELAAARGPFRAVAYARGEAWLLLDVRRLLAFDFAAELTDLTVDFQELSHWLAQLPSSHATH